jgi:Tfp pilus assembly protein PilF
LTEKIHSLRWADDEFRIAHASHDASAAEALRRSGYRENNAAQALRLYATAADYLTRASQDPHYPRREDAFAALAEIHLTMGRYPQATVAVQALNNTFPESKDLPLLELRLADLEARDGKLDDARARYNVLQRSRDAFVAALALYQRGWLQICEGNRREAIPLLLQAQAASRRDEKSRQYHSLTISIWQDLMSDGLFDAFLSSQAPSF